MTVGIEDLLASLGGGSGGGDVVWGFNQDGTPIIKSSSDVKSGYANLSKKELAALKGAMSSLGIKPTVSAQKSFWSTIVDGAASAYAGGDKKSNVFDFMYKFVNKQSASGIAGSGGSATQIYKELTAPAKAQADLTKQMSDVLGRLPTKAELNDFTKKLNANEKKFYTKVVQTSTGATTYKNSFDSAAFLEQYVLSKVNFAKDLDAGAAATTQDSVNQLLRSNGIYDNVSSVKKSLWMKRVLSGEANFDQIKTEINDVAGKVYIGFADVLKANPGLTLADAASEYTTTYAKMLELDPQTVDMKDVLSKATVNVNGKYQPMTVFDYQKSLRKDPRFQYTSTAASEAEGLAYSFAKAFGVNL